MFLIIQFFSCLVPARIHQSFIAAFLAQQLSARYEAKEMHLHEWRMNVEE